ARLARRMLVAPRARAVLRMQRPRRPRVERIVEVRRPAARAHPRLRLRDAPVGEIELRIVAAGDPPLAADPKVVGELAPRLRARLRAARDRVELPQRLAPRRVVAGDPAAVL